MDRLPGTLSDTPWGLSGDTPGGRLWRFSGESFATADEHIVCRLFVSHLASFLPRLFPTLFVCYCEAGGVKSRPSNFRPRQFTRGEAEERQNRQSPETAYSGGRSWEAKVGGKAETVRFRVGAAYPVVIITWVHYQLGTLLNSTRDETVENSGRGDYRGQF